MAGLLGDVTDWFTARGDYADPTKIDPRYGVPYADVRQAGINTLANVSALLLAAGQGGIEPSQRAQLLAQLGPAMGGMNTDLYNASQRRLMQAQMDEKRTEAEQHRQFGELMKNPEEFKARTGFDPKDFAGMPAKDALGVMRQIQAARLSRDPNAAALTLEQLNKARRDNAIPPTFESGGVTYKWDDKGNPVPITPNRPQFGTGPQSEMYRILEAGRTDESVRTSPAYSMAWQSISRPSSSPEVQPDGTVIMKSSPGIDLRAAGYVPPVGLPAPAAGNAQNNEEGGGTLKSSPYVLSEGEAKEYRNKLYGLTKFEAAVDRLTEHVEQNGLQLGATGRVGGTQNGLYKEVLMQLKEAQNLGVLNGPDLQLLMEQLADPTKFSTALRGLGTPEYFYGQLDALRAKTDMERRAIDKMLRGNVPDAIRNRGGTQQNAPSSNSQGTVLEFDPQTRKVR